MSFVYELKKEKESLLKRVNAINVLLESYVETTNEEHEVTDHSINMDKFPKNGTYLEQIIFVIKIQNRFIHVNEIVEIIAPYYIDKEKQWLRRRISAVLSHAKSKGDIPNLTNVNYSPSKKHTVWGSRDWLDNDNKIKSEYTFKSASEQVVIKPIL